jgi:FkbM family methyltransferase
VFVHVLNAKLSGDFDLYRRILSPCEYFDEDVVRLAEDEVYLDVGAYRGRAIVEFANRTRGKYDGLIAFEPDKRTLDMLRRTVEEHGIRKVELHNKGAWDRHAFLGFHDGREGGSRILEPSAADIPANSIEVDAIDNVLGGRRVTYLSMDIEGAEHNAIRGAEQTIRTWMPKMAVSVYHKREDLFDLLLLINRSNPRYRFHMRHYTENQTETVLYAL